MFNITVAQQNYLPGDLVGNADKIIGAIDTCYKKNDSRVIVFTEMALTGYPILDLILYPSFIDDHDVQLQRIKEFTIGKDLHVVLGCIRKNSNIRGKPFHNSLVVIHDGVIEFTYDKQLLPTYNIFDEGRYFEKGTGSRYFKINQCTVAFFICEDLWGDVEGIYNQQTPVEDPNLHLADLVISINASPSNVNKMNARMKAVLSLYNHGLRRYTPIVYANSVGGYDDIIFDGHSFVTSGSTVDTFTAKGFEEDTITFPLSPNKLFYTKTPGYAYVTKDELLYKHAVLGIQDYFRKCGGKKAVVGCSGGIDSAVVLALAVDAIGKDNVLAITMPSRYSSPGSVDDSVTLCKNLGITLLNLPIADQVTSAHLALMDTKVVYQAAATAVWDNKILDVANENIQPRIRATDLYAFSNRLGYWVLATSNKSETCVGYFTAYGDSCGALAPIADMWKMEVYELAAYYNKKYGRDIIPQAIIAKAPSAELAPGQQDTDSLPPYPYLDAMLALVLENGYLSSDSEFANRRMLQEYAKKYGADKVVEVFRKFEAAEFKRQQALTKLIRCHGRAFGFGRRVPIAQGYTKTIDYKKIYSLT